MAYDEGLTERLREFLADRYKIEEKKDDRRHHLYDPRPYVLRHRRRHPDGQGGPDHYAAALRRPHASEMDFTGKSMKGFVYVDPAGFETEEDL